jgi:LacI family transcriptional regulator
MHQCGKGSKSHSRIDIRDVALLAGVSISTVSRVTNRKGTVNRDMTERVWRAVHELNYQADPQARARSSPGGATSSG